MIAFPNAKINLGLHVINKREDGFHNLETTFLSVKLHDMLEVVEQHTWNKGQAKCILELAGIPVSGDPNSNLITKAYQLLDDLYSLPPVHAMLYKKIPMGAGLGGGSSDAAFMLSLLNQKFNLQQRPDQLKHWAAHLGSDCAYFIENKTSFVFGKGHELEPISLDVKGLWLVLITPSIHSSTALAYQNVKTRGLPKIGNSLRDYLKLPISEWNGKVENDFESSVFNAYPELAQIKQKLYDQGAVYASMSGSGSSIFGLFTIEPILDEWLINFSPFIQTL